MKKGFTLLELLIVVIIIGILATIAIPRYQAMTRRAEFTEAASMLDALRGAVERYGYQNGAFTGIDCSAATNNLDIDSPNTNPDRFHNYVCASAASTTYTITATNINVAADTLTVAETGDYTGTGNYVNFLP